MIWVVGIFGLMIFIHELGHFLVAKRFGVRVTEFALGFGKKLIAFKKDETEYSLRLFPLGGYVKMVGEGEAGDPNDPGNFQNKTALERSLIIAAGPIMNCVLAVLLLAVLGLFIGKMQGVMTNEIYKVYDNTPASQIGLLKGDIVVSINGERIENGQMAIELIQPNVGKTLTLLVERSGKEQTFEVLPILDPKSNKGIIGVFFKPKPTFAFPGLQAAKENIYTTFTTVATMPFIVVESLFTGKMQWKEVVEGSAGPIGIGQFIFDSASSDANIGYIIWIASMLNVAIGLFNLYPIPALDGARIVFLALGALLPKPIDPEKEELVHFVGFVLLILLVVAVSYNDVLRLIHGKKFF